MITEQREIIQNELIKALELQQQLIDKEVIAMQQKASASAVPELQVQLMTVAITLQIVSNSIKDVIIAMYKQQSN